MFERYDIKIITQTINNVTDIFSDGTIEYSTTHNDEGIAKIRIHDTENYHRIVANESFEPVSQDQKEAFRWIKNQVEAYENIGTDKQSLINYYLAAVENGSYNAGTMNEFEQAGKYLYEGTAFVWDPKWMDKNEEWWTKVKTLVERHRS